MNNLYTKTLLYAYPKLNAVIKQIDEVIDKILFSSMDNYRPCMAQCEKIIAYRLRKERVKILIKKMDKVISKLQDEELVHLDYKFFKSKKKEEFKDLDTTSRAYFRKQVAIVNKVSELLEKVGLNDEVFKRDYLSMKFFRYILGRVIEVESFTKKYTGEGKRHRYVRKTARIVA